MSLGAFGIIEWTSSEEDSVNRMANEIGSTMTLHYSLRRVTRQVGVQ